MSMNFGREQALLRQRLTAKGSAELAAQRVAQFGDRVKFLGADDAEVLAAATDLAETYPEMGRAQMTAFVRTLWGSKTHELRCVGVEILAQRASLLEPPDMPFVEELIKEATTEDLGARIANDVLGPLVCKNKKLWKNLGKLAKSADEKLMRAAVRASKAPIEADSSVFSRFEDLVTPLLAEADAVLQQAIDDVLAAAAEQDADAVKAFADAHGRKLKSK
jgi:ribosomal 50S subunit-associated protein YjgA (DUF615 family)